MTARREPRDSVRVDVPAVLEIEVLAHAPTAFFLCQHCEVVWSGTGFSRGVREEQLRTGLPAELQREYTQVSDWVRQVVTTYGERVAVDLIDVASVRGFWKALRHRVRRYPVIIVGGRERFAGTDLGAAAAAVARRVSALAA